MPGSINKSVGSECLILNRRQAYLKGFLPLVLLNPESKYVSGTSESGRLGATNSLQSYSQLLSLINDY